MPSLLQGKTIKTKHKMKEEKEKPKTKLTVIDKADDGSELGILEVDGKKVYVDAKDFKDLVKDVKDDTK